MLDEESGIARCPYDPAHKSTAVYSGTYPSHMLLNQGRRHEFEGGGVNALKIGGSVR